jgi:hypothetical protein
MAIAILEVKHDGIVWMQRVGTADGATGAVDQGVPASEGAFRVYASEPVVEASQSGFMPLDDMSAGAREPTDKMVERLSMLRQLVDGAVQGARVRQ